MDIDFLICKYFNSYIFFLQPECSGTLTLTKTGCQSVRYFIASTFNVNSLFDDNCTYGKWQWQEQAIYQVLSHKRYNNIISGPQHSGTTAFRAKFGLQIYSHRLVRREKFYIHS